MSHNNIVQLLLDLWDDICHAREIRKATTPDQADRFMVRQHGCYLAPAVKGFYGHRITVDLGITHSTKPTEVRKRLMQKLPTTS